MTKRIAIGISQPAGRSRIFSEKGRNAYGFGRKVCSGQLGVLNIFHCIVLRAAHDTRRRKGGGGRGDTDSHDFVVFDRNKYGCDDDEDHQ